MVLAGRPIPVAVGIGDAVPGEQHVYMIVTDKADPFGADLAGFAV